LQTVVLLLTAGAIVYMLLLMRYDVVRATRKLNATANANRKLADDLQANSKRIAELEACCDQMKARERV
jgi:hypothetical protein